MKSEKTAQNSGKAKTVPVILTICLLAGVIAALSFLGGQTGKPIKVIVPFGEGGGSDTFARAVARIIEDQGFFPRKFVIYNVEGAGGTVGSRRAMNALPDGNTILFLHEGILTAKYSGKVLYGPEAFEPIAATGEVGAIIAVHTDSEIQSLSKLLEKAKTDPDTVTFGANIGAPSYFWARLLEHESGARFRYVQAGGGSARLGELKGKHLEVSAFSVAEYLSFQSEGLRALAFLGKERHPALPEVPTAIEQGCDVTAGNIQAWWAPKDTPDAVIVQIAHALHQAMQTPEMIEFLDKNQIDPVFLTGHAFAKEIARRETAMAGLEKLEMPDLPNLPGIFAIIAGVAGLVGIGISIQQGWFATRTRSDRNGETKQPGWFADPTGLIRGTGLLFLAVTMVAALQTSPFGFKIVAAVFLMFAFRLLNPARQLRDRVISILVALAIPFFCHWLFTSVLTVDLP
ncbi:MAG: tripartite tricarboxylate transporter substrate binding protein [Verrucomicrobiales bacterium]|nr:tripartite tricarboxylate transporter substrate binding protein [Verrucomicrobiales bacterium]